MKRIIGCIAILTTLTTAGASRAQQSPTRASTASTTSAQAGTKGPCDEKKVPAAPANASGLVELQTNPSRPTFTVRLADRTSTVDRLSLSPKRRHLGLKPRD